MLSRASIANTCGALLS